VRRWRGQARLRPASAAAPSGTCPPRALPPAHRAGRSFACSMRDAAASSSGRKLRARSIQACGWVSIFMLVSLAVRSGVAAQYLDLGID
jgi:hypothetical protein